MVDSLADELIASTQKPASGESCDSAPSKPKFLENHINRVSKKVSQDTNGLINVLPLDTDDPETDKPLSPDSEQCLVVVESLADELIGNTDDPETDKPLSPDSEQCLVVVESLADELIGSTQRPVSGVSCDLGGDLSLFLHLDCTMYIYMIGVTVYGISYNCSKLHMNK